MLKRKSVLLAVLCCVGFAQADDAVVQIKPDVPVVTTRTKEIAEPTQEQLDGLTRRLDDALAIFREAITLARGGGSLPADLEHKLEQYMSCEPVVDALTIHAVQRDEVELATFILGFIRMHAYLSGCTEQSRNFSDDSDNSDDDSWNGNWSDEEQEDDTASTESLTSEDERFLAVWHKGFYTVVGLGAASLFVAWYLGYFDLPTIDIAGEQFPHWPSSSRPSGPSLGE